MCFNCEKKGHYQVDCRHQKKKHDSKYMPAARGDRIPQVIEPSDTLVARSGVPNTGQPPTTMLTATNRGLRGLTGAHI